MELVDPLGEAATMVVDNRGMLCAQGILRLMRTMRSVAPGQVVKVISSDPAAEHDYPAWCRTTGHAFLGDTRERDPEWGSLILSFIRKRADDAGP